MSGKVTVTFPVKDVRGERWGDMCSHSLSHEICGEVVKQKPDMSFSGGHRVRHYYFKKNVHWKIPAGIQLDITNVAIGNPPRRNGR